MGTVNLSLPDSLTAFVDEQIANRGYESVSEYVRDLIRREWDREKLRGLLLEGANSPLSDVPEEEFFEELRNLARGGE